MARSVLVIHGAGEPRRRRGKVYWEPLLGDSLGRGYRVLAPRMPRPEYPQSTHSTGAGLDVSMSS
jgi:hypothetical protein